MEQNWIAIFGNADVDAGAITHAPLPVANVTTAIPNADGSTSPPPLVFLRSNVEFEQGTISWECKLSAAGDRIQLMVPSKPSSTAADVAGADVPMHDLGLGVNVLAAPYGFALWNGQTWAGLGGVGHGSSVPVDVWLPFKLTARGSTIELYVNNIKLAGVTQTLRRGQLGALLQGGACAIRNITVATNAPVCFVVMQFTAEFNTLYTDVIRPVCEANGYKVIRADDFYTSGQIIEDVTQSIRTASLIIADVTPDNPNVFYELGFAHAIGKSTVLLSDRKRERLPFDISGFRTIFYDNTIGGKNLVETRLKQHLEALHQS